MKRNNDAGFASTSWSRLLNFPAALVNRLAWRFGRVNRCELKNENILFHKGLFTTQTINASQIKRWTVHPEMGFDVVQIELSNGDIVTWMDKYNDLLSSLRAVAQTKEEPTSENV